MRSLGDLLDECDRHLLALREAMARCPEPLTEAHFAIRNPELIAALDQFAYRFIKLQDVMSVQLFRQFALEALWEPVESLPILDILNLLERYRYLASAARWQEIREIRNQITHEWRRSSALGLRRDSAPGIRTVRRCQPRTPDSARALGAS